MLSESITLLRRLMFLILEKYFTCSSYYRHDMFSKPVYMYNGSILNLFIIVSSFLFNVCLFEYLFRIVFVPELGSHQGFQTSFAFLINGMFNHNGIIWHERLHTLYLSFVLLITFSVYFTSFDINVWFGTKIVGGETRIKLSFNT